MQATSTIGFTNAAGTVARTTGTAANVTAGCAANCANANKNWVDANIQITPQTATNPAGTNHVLTITVNATGGGVLAAGTATASIVTPPSTTGSFVGSPTCNYAGGAATASCTVTITSAVAGVTQVQATSNVGFTNAAGTLTRTTGTAANVTAGCAANCANATKNWVDANIQITPLTATNPTGTNHVLTVHVNVNAGNGFVNAPAGTLITTSLTNTGGATATFVGGNTCTTSGTTGSCTVTISSPTGGETMIHATTTVVIGGVTVTRATGDSHTGDSADAIKDWIPPPPPNVSNPAIGITKNPKTQSVLPGGTATWTIVVTNTGNVTLTNVRVTDPLAPGCNRTSADIPGLASMAAGRVAQLLVLAGGRDRAVHERRDRHGNASDRRRTSRRPTRPR